MSRPTQMDPDRERLAAARAATTERRNRPAGLLLAAAALVVVALLVAAWGVAQRRAAQDSLRRAVAARDVLHQKAAEIRAVVDNEARQELIEQYRPIPDIRSRLQSHANDAGLAEPPALGQIDQRRFSNDSPLVRRSIEATLRNADADASMRWIEIATGEIDGLHVTDITLTPTQQNWTVQVTFSRWEIDQ